MAARPGKPRVAANARGSKKRRKGTFVIEATSIVTGLSGRYATALYELASEQGALPAVEANLTALKRAIDSSADLKRLIKSPVFSRDDQARAIEAIAQRMGVSDLTRRFLGLVTSKRRLFVLPKIIDDFIRIAAHARGELTANVTSAKPLNNNQVENIKAALKSALGRTVTVSQSLDPDLLGGLVVRVGSVMVDSSLKTQLAKLQVAMREVN